MTKHSITPCLWFAAQAEEAARFYCSLFQDSAIKHISYYPQEAAMAHGMPEKSVLSVSFTLAGHPFTALNAQPAFVFNPAISLYVVCRTPEEASSLWDALRQGGQEMMPMQAYPWSERYGWLSDRFGLSWQIACHSEPQFTDKISPALLFMGKRQYLGTEAVHWYTQLFPESSIVHVVNHEEGEGSEPGSLKHAMFKLNNQTFMAMGNSMEHAFDFNESISFQIFCDNQETIDHYWNAFAQAGQESQCGWIRDQFGIWWQVIPAVLPKLMSNPASVAAVTKAFMAMKKFDIAALLKAAK